MMQTRLTHAIKQGYIKSSDAAIRRSFCASLVLFWSRGVAELRESKEQERGQQPFLAKEGPKGGQGDRESV